MKTKEMTALRTAARNLGAKGEAITNAMFYAALGADEQKERDRIRKRCGTLVKTGELKRIKPGQYRYNPNAAPARSGELITRMWRSLKSANPGFTAQGIAKISGASYTHVIKYFRFLESDSFITRHGRTGNTLKYKGTKKMRETQRAPMPPRPLGDPFEVERKHVHDLVGLFMIKDPNRPDVKKQIAEKCRAILDRFETKEN